MDKSSAIFGNPIPEKTLRKADKAKAKFVKKYGDDSKKEYHLALRPIAPLQEMGVENLVLSEEPLKLPEKAVVVGNIRMGFGHYRISIAIASCAKALGYTPVWMDLASFDATGSKMIREQNDLYSLASKISQKSKLFNALVWEPLNSEGFRKITYNAADQRNSELLAPLYHDLPKDVPFVATHAWPAQGAVHAGLTHVVNAIPDNWPMALHLAEGSIHVVQTPRAYFGYKCLDGFDKEPLKGMGEEDIKLVGHYVDHELVENVEADCARRIKRRKAGAPMRILLSVGGAGAGEKQFLSMLRHLLPLTKQDKVALFLNFGDHKGLYDKLTKQMPELGEASTFFNAFEEMRHFLDNDSEMRGVYLIENDDIFEAVYSTNLLMRHVDLLVTKPSELVFYPIPKVFQRHIGGHEVYGGIYGEQLGDATYECPDAKSMNRMLDTLLNDPVLYENLCTRIVKLKKDGVYNGGYEAVKLAVKGR
ncbi:MAG: hypothetical protein K6E59_01425 [Bacilli bacterium]|nr:hypothetical protein [Bacilli bacterium]